MPVRLISTIAAASLVAAVAALSPASQAANPPLWVYPAKGTLVASTKTQISFRGASKAELDAAHVRIRGSVSGPHSGVIRAHSDGQGASFLPNTAFHTGEHVRVYADFKLVGEENGYVRFRIARPPGNFSLPTQHDEGGHPPGEQDFKTRPDLHPPSIVVDKREPHSIGQGPIFVGAKAGPGQDGTMIFDDRGKLIWFKRAPSHRTTFDFRAQTYQGQPVLTWWQGKSRPGQGLGAGQIYDDSYRKIEEVQTGNGYQADLHEFEISSRSTGLVLAYNPVEFGGTVAMDEVVQEIDIPTGLVMFEWHSLGQVSSKESDAPHHKGQPFDVAHVNSIQRLPDGNFLISARHTHAIYKLNARTAQIMWRLGGNRSDFSLSQAAKFRGQHHARLQQDGSITLYDNGGPPDPGHESRALWLNVNESTRKVNVRRSYRFPGGLKAFSQGGMQVLPSGDVFVAWGGSVPYFTEFTGGGTMVWNAHFNPKGDDTYRAYRFPWSGHPNSKPDIALERQSDGRIKVYASWNGATEVVKWEVLKGPDASAALVPVKTFTKGKFEDYTRIPNTTDYIAVRGLGAGGEILGTSKAVRAPG